MTGASEEHRREALEAWDIEVDRLTTPSWSSACVSAIAIAIGAFTIVAVAHRLSLLLSGGRALVTMGAGVLLAMAMIAAPLWRWRVRAARSAESVRAARSSASRASCPRCRRSIEGERCACGARLLEAEGLLIVATSDARFRRQRWRAEVRARLRARAEDEWTHSPALWTFATVAALGVAWAIAAALGGAPPCTIEAPLGLDRQESMHGTAHAASEPAPLPAGPATRSPAPAWVGTQVLAGDGSGVYAALAVIVRADGPRVFAVFADGSSRWVRARELLAPELAPGDAVEVRRGDRFVRAEVIDRVGPALRVRAGGEERWTTAARVRVRCDAAHRTGEGLESEVPPGAWIEARVDGALRPGLQVDIARDRETALVVLSDGSPRWVPRDDVRAQRIEPGVRVWVDGRRGPLIVAARIGDALAVVDERGARSWTSLARVRREVAR